jgi:hypothetical protein
MRPATSAILTLAFIIVFGCAIDTAKQASSADDASFWCQLIACGVVVPIEKR